MTLLSILIIIASALLIFVVFVQNPKGGGLSSDFGAAQQIGGVQKTNDFIDKTTWSLAAVIGVLSVVMTLMGKSDVPTPAPNNDAGTENVDPNAPAQGGDQLNEAPKGE